MHTIRFCSVVFGITSSLAVTHDLSWLCIVREHAWSLSHWRTTEMVTLSRVALGGWTSAVYDQRYNCHNLRDGGRCPPATTFTTPRLLQCQQQAYKLRIAISAYRTCIRRRRQGGSHRNIAIPFGMENLECCGCPMVKNFEGIFICFDTTHKRDRHTDKHRMTA